MTTPRFFLPNHRVRVLPAKPYRWRFPAGTISQTARGLFRWERTEEDPHREGRFRLVSGDLDIVDAVGYLQPADREMPLLRDPMPDWSSRLPAFPFCHWFHDFEVTGDLRVADFGPWFCHCGFWRPTAGALRAKCVAANQQTEIMCI